LATDPHEAPLTQQPISDETRPLFIEERGHGRDGELLRDFILRREHLKEAGGCCQMVENCRELEIEPNEL